MDPCIKLAKKAIKHYLLTGEIIEAPQNLPQQILTKRAGVFVCFKNKKQLRGCIGTFSPAYKNIAEEIIQNTISAATQDPRFLPVKAGELNDLKITIDILSGPQKVENEKISQLDHRKFGVIVKSEKGRKTGLLLPNLEGVNSVDEQIYIACQKAGIDPKSEKFHVYKFEVERHEE
ncbi:MAG TPA: AmmeMemoRadiSam system protein A [Candidatus Uhrbacteria bacterium]|nr:AmmeMemoRadiSam system protein A [Candidatus Uhrbacteria bacterium]